MRPMQEFEFASGSVVGTRHTWHGSGFVGKNNQDAVLVTPLPDGEILGVVSDGCGSSEYSEFGARLICSLVANSVRKSLSMGGQMLSDAEWEEVRLDIVSNLRVIAPKLYGISSDYLLATIVGFFIHEYQTIIFRVGDGYSAINRSIEKYGPYFRNAPPFIAYGGGMPTMSSVRLRKEYSIAYGDDPFGFKIDKYDTADVDSVFVATDGFGDLIDAIDDDATMPGRPSAPVGPISRIWEDDFCSLDNFLRACNTKRITRDSEDDELLKKHSGLLPDDTSIVVARRQDTGKEDC